MRQKFATIRTLGPGGTLRRLAQGARQALWRNDSLIIFRIRPGELRPVTPHFAVGKPGRMRSIAAGAISSRERSGLPARLATELAGAVPGQRLHLIEIDGRVVAWGFSAVSPEPWRLTETGSVLPMEPGGVCLTAFETVPCYRGRRFYPSIMTLILLERFGEGAPAAYIWCAPDNAASYGAIRKVGFRELAVHRRVGALGISRLTESQPVG